MSIMIDMIGAAILTGTLFLGILNLNVGMSNETDKALIERWIQSDVVQLDRQLEFDILKVAHKVPKAGAILIADTSRFKFKSNLYNVGAVTDEIEYELGPLYTVSPNPNDRILYRRENGSTLRVSYRATQFRLSYFDSTNAPLTAPVTGLNLDLIRSIRVQMRLEFPEPVDTTRTGFEAYLGQSYRNLFYPMNLK